MHNAIIVNTFATIYRQHVKKNGPNSCQPLQSLASDISVVIHIYIFNIIQCFFQRTTKTQSRLCKRSLVLTFAVRICEKGFISHKFCRARAKLIHVFVSCSGFNQTAWMCGYKNIFEFRNRQNKSGFKISECSLHWLHV